MANLPSPPTLVLTSESDKAKARKWFDRAKSVADSKNYDYAIQCYISGVTVWPEALDEGHKPLRVVATQRKMSGGKPLGFLESRKHPTSGKDPRQCALNAEHLWAHEPGNVGLMETVIVNAAKAGFGPLGVWMAAICVDAMAAEKKVSAGRYGDLCEALDSIGEMAQKAQQWQLAMDAYAVMVRIADAWHRQYPNSQDASKAYGNASSKQTIVKGRFGSADSFRESLKDKQSQIDMQDKDRAVQSDQRVDELISKTRAEYEADKSSTNKLNAYIDLLTRREKEEDENKAIEVLLQAATEARNYSLKVKADDIRMKQLTREGRKVAAKFKANPNDAEVVAEARAHKAKQLDFEIASYQERARNYPTDLRIKFGLGERYFKAKRFDDAIPLFQAAQADGKHRSLSRLYIGRCFFERGSFDEAIGILRGAVKDHEIASDDTGKELHYWLARSLESNGQIPDAVSEFGQLIQWDYNFKDARARLDQLRKSGVAAG